MPISRLNIKLLYVFEIEGPFPLLLSWQQTSFGQKKMCCFISRNDHLLYFVIMTFFDPFSTTTTNSFLKDISQCHLLIQKRFGRASGLLLLMPFFSGSNNHRIHLELPFRILNCFGFVLNPKILFQKNHERKSLWWR